MEIYIFAFRKPFLCSSLLTLLILRWAQGLVTAIVASNLPLNGKMGADPANIFVVERADILLRAEFELIGISCEINLCHKSPSVLWDIRVRLRRYGSFSVGHYAQFILHCTLY
jgi:hypothetical protein